jgi:hypothetical protein
LVSAEINGLEICLSSRVEWRLSSFIDVGLHESRALFGHSEAVCSLYLVKSYLCTYLLFENVLMRGDLGRAFMTEVEVMSI